MAQKSGCTPMLKALADETRWRIVQRLFREERMMVTVLAEELNVAQPNMSKHLRILRDAGIVESEKCGTAVWCHIAAEFRQRARGGETTLDLGCCTFRIEGAESK